MGFQYSSLQGTEVTISGSIATSPFLLQPNSDQTAWSVYIASSGNQQDIHTPSTGKRSYISGVLFCNNTGAPRVCEISQGAGGATVLNLTIADTAYIVIGSGSSIPLDVNNKVTVVCNAANIRCTVWGYDA